MLNSNDALNRLREGNGRFATGDSQQVRLRPRDVADGQEPFAVVLGCSDSRVPTEIVFDQSLGDLFVIRVAGNIVAPSQIGSIEFAADTFGTRLVLVLGHTRCGAVKATLEQMRRPPDEQSPGLRSIVDRIRPSVDGLDTEGDPESLLAKAVRANIRACVEQLRRGSEILAGLVEQDGLLIVGAEYSLETGIVEFFNRGAQDDPA